MSQILRRPAAKYDLIAIHRYLARGEPISRFRDHIVIYRPIPDGIEVYRVLHGARDIDGLLAEEFRVKDDAPDEDAN